MELTFTKTDGKWVAEFEATADFNLHIERDEIKDLRLYQKGALNGNYEYVREQGYNAIRKTFDSDFSALVYPKWIKIVSEVQPTMAVVTFAQ